MTVKWNNKKKYLKTHNRFISYDSRNNRNSRNMSLRTILSSSCHFSWKVVSIERIHRWQVETTWHLTTVWHMPPHTATHIICHKRWYAKIRINTKCALLVITHTHRSMSAESQATVVNWSANKSATLGPKVDKVSEWTSKTTIFWPMFNAKCW